MPGIRMDRQPSTAKLLMMMSSFNKGPRTASTTLQSHSHFMPTSKLMAGASSMPGSNENVFNFGSNFGGFWPMLISLKSIETPLATRLFGIWLFTFGTTSVSICRTTAGSTQGHNCSTIKFTNDKSSSAIGSLPIRRSISSPPQSSFVFTLFLILAPVLSTSSAAVSATATISGAASSNSSGSQHATTGTYAVDSARPSSLRVSIVHPQQ
mmetsp:Transcript_34507/g.75503  ORF Transcript_34507/g.75503 Transcript_34507/m.75503 type:complete len:210 (-) Transcript_34507:49-678(-)